MSTAELQNKLKEKIDNLEEDYLLEELLGIIDMETSKTEVFKIPDEHKDGLEKSLSQMDNGETTSHKLVIQELRGGLRS